MKLLKSSIFAASLLILAGCGSTAPILSTPIENIDLTPLKETPLTEKELQTWGHKDLVADTIPGMSVDKAYAEIIKGKKGTQIIVAVLDSGIDIDHEDLDDVIWTNPKEIANNGKDDDKNGYIDDIHGWNFLGDSYDENMEKTRIVKKGTSHPDYAKAKAEMDEEYEQYNGSKTRLEQILSKVKEVNTALKAYFKKDDYSIEEINAIKTPDTSLQEPIAIAKQILGNGRYKTIDAVEEAIKGDIESVSEYLNYYLNTNFNGRTPVGDDPNDITDTNYGNGNVKHVKKTESHGTHVAGIIAAERNNGKGVNGVANNVAIMAVRTVPNGDEYDKDVALAIRYAVDNGAQIINTSFGKYFSPNSEWVRDAIAYAGKNNVLIVNAAGNENTDLDTKPVYPNDQITTGAEVSDTFLTVGALQNKYGSQMVAGYSNYGQTNVDIFAPGSSIYSTFPENEYKAIGGTSMASPGVAGVAALVWSQYPKLTAAQVKQIIMQSGLPINRDVVVDQSKEAMPFSKASRSGKIANAYNALILADKVSRGQVKL
ncbi:S8 family serine peptidase [Kordia sp. YSTF-M3]|uniref:S8 family serine peptidase n=1 Tax=Kordia aestuariivivens TaxID=2759037 RepID=A0ABR7QEF0_9FLAO|nr:S8 family peptidase [Kordia aestuariivivens]MBC8756945.1 S8 family serine peptidase [Kordia aestuariivivens]